LAIASSSATIWLMSACLSLKWLAGQSVEGLARALDDLRTSGRISRERDVVKRLPDFLVSIAQ
jgi:hypothetical protein